MRRLIFTLLFVVGFIFAGSSASAVLAQGDEYTFADVNVDYQLVLPTSWRLADKPDNISSQAGFVNGDKLSGYLRIRKESLDDGVSLSELARRYRDDTLRSRPGYVDGKEERFAGNLSGIISNYEYTYNGKQMQGRIYYLQADNRTVYSLHFTGLRDKLNVIRSETDAISRSFKMKKKE